MEIKTNNSIREKYIIGFQRSSPPTEIVIHGTGGGSTGQGMIDWMMDGERAAEYRKGIALFHYLNDRDGTVTEIIDPALWVYHSSSGAHDMTTIGIEHMNPDARNQAQYTDEQYQSDCDLIIMLLKKYPLINSIIGHVQNTLKYSGLKYVKVPCPGNYDWTLLQKMLAVNEYNFELSEEHLTMEAIKCQIK
jgi:N-acetyl-anhydromuramyl-L-alanine amidase AmpD